MSQLSASVAAFLRHDHGLLIDGSWNPGTGARIDVENPATGEKIAQIGNAGPHDVDRAVTAAHRTLHGRAWRALPGPERGRMLWRLADLLERDRDALALVETLDNGMPLSLARFSIASAIDCLRYNAGWAGKIGGETPPVSVSETLAYTLREPVGVVAAITPWNLPLPMAAAKIAPAIAAGCTVVLKPAELTSLTALWLGTLVAEAGFPAGAINILTGTGGETGAALTAHPLVSKIAFTGSTATGKAIGAAAMGNLKRVSLELGGKSPVVIFSDADLEAAAAGAARGIFLNSGQVCVAGSRLYAHHSIFDRLLDRVVEHGRGLAIGPGIDPGSELGPLISASQKQRVLAYVDDARESGCETLPTGIAPPVGHFVPPTIVTGARPDMPIYREEVFGPVLTALPFEEDDLEAIAARANDTNYGLAAHVWTRDASKAHKLARLIQAGSIRINGAGLDHNLPFGGFKQSGLGRENGREGVLAYTELKSVALKL